MLYEVITLVTTTTRTGADQVARLGELVEHRYAPLDYPGAVGVITSYSIHYTKLYEPATKW